jgi:hypothetical protein
MTAGRYGLQEAPYLFVSMGKSEVLIVASDNVSVTQVY